MADAVITILAEQGLVDLTAPDAPIISLAAAPLAGITDHGQLAGLSDDDHPHYLTEARGDARYPSFTYVDSAITTHEAAGDPHPQYLDAVPNPLAIDNDDKTVTSLVVNRSVTSDSIDDADIMTVKYLGLRSFWTNEVGLPRAQQPDGKESEVVLKLVSGAGDFQTDVIQAVSPGSTLVFRVGRYGGVTISPTSTSAEGLKIDMPSGSSNAIKVTRGGSDVFRIGAADKVNIHSGLTMQGSKIESVATPTANGDAANKQYVDGRIWKGTQAQYDALGVYDPDVLYVVTG